MSDIHIQLARFAGVGASGTAAHYLTLVVLVELAAADPVVASTAGFAVGAMVNYVLNYHYTFASTKKHRETATKFVLVAVATAGLNAVLMAALVKVEDFNYFLNQVFATAVVFVVNFLLNKSWTFRVTEEFCGINRPGRNGISQSSKPE